MLAKRVQAVFSFQVRCVRFFWGVKKPQPNCLVVDFNLGFPTVVLFVDACKTGFVVAALSILRVLRVSRFSQIGYPVVSSVAVDVIKLFFRPFSSNIQPRQSMRGVQYVVQSDGYVPMPHAAASYISGATAPARHVPPKDAGFRVVGYKRLKAVLRDSFGVHALYNIKQGWKRQLQFSGSV